MPQRARANSSRRAGPPDQSFLYGELVKAQRARLAILRGNDGGLASFEDLDAKDLDANDLDANDLDAEVVPPEPRKPRAPRVAPPLRLALPGPESRALAQQVARTAIKLPAAVARGLMEAFVPSRGQDGSHDAALRRLWLKGLSFIGVFACVIGVWAVASGMSSAVVASGQFVVDTSVKKVQHPTGGIIGEIRVREGDWVSEGDILIRLDETVTRANLQVIVKQLDELAAHRARLEAERDGRAAFQPPPGLAARLADPEVAQVVVAEQRLFEARRTAREGQRAQLTKRIAQLQNEVVGLQAQHQAKLREAEIVESELKGVRELFEKRLVALTRLTTLERQLVTIEGERGHLTASIAQSEGKVSETELQIIQIDQDLRAEVQKELRETRSKITELSERRVAPEDQLKRVDIRAPRSGYVHQLTAQTIGGVVTPAEPMMLIVPAEEELVLEARVAPQDRDQLHAGQKALVRVNTSNQRNTPEVNGLVTRISADVQKDPGSATAQPYYTVRVAIPKGEHARLKDVSLAAGMQAEVFIEVGSRTPLEYLLKPLSDQIARAFRER